MANEVYFSGLSGNARLAAILNQAVIQKLTDTASADRFLTPFNLTTGKTPHYYQRIAIDRVIQAILSGRRRVLVIHRGGSGLHVPGRDRSERRHPRRGDRDAARRCCRGSRRCIRGGR